MHMADNQDNSQSKDSMSTGSKATKNVMKTIRELLVSVCKTFWKVGKEDPIIVIHGLKMAAALTLVSFMYLLEPLSERVGQNATWAVITVLLVLEFTAGATLRKGLNRMFGTVCATALAFFVELVAKDLGKVGRGIFVGASVFLIGFMATYIRFIPYVKKNYDYAVLVFLITFNLLMALSYPVHDVLHIALVRLYTVFIGCGICLLMCLLILPNWSGEDLHNSTVCKFDGLSKSIEACVNEYFEDKDLESIEEGGRASSDLIHKGYRAILDSKSTDENMARFAGWEPRFSKNRQRHPWHLYVKLGGALRHFGYTAVALHDCLESKIQTPRSVHSLFRGPCMQVAEEVSKTLLELATSIKDCRCFSRDALLGHLNGVLQELNTAIRSQPSLFLVRPALSNSEITCLELSEALPLEAPPFAPFALLLVELVARLEPVIENVEALSRAASFIENSGKDVVIEMSGEENGREIQTDQQVENAGENELDHVSTV